VRTTSPHDRWSEAADRLARDFDEEFRLVVADTEQLRRASFALRHEVYCRELGFEPVRADGLERDAYDHRALHYLLAHVPSGVWAGCVRVVLDDAAGGLPFEPVLGVVPAARSRGAVGEISRLAVPHGFRRSVRALPDRPRHPHAVLGLALTAAAATAEAGLETAVCMMTSRLAVQLATYGMHFAQLTDEVGYRGRRALFGMTPLVTCREVDPELQGVLRALRAQIGRRPPMAASIRRYAPRPSKRSTSNGPSSAMSAG
jgi:N-acyl amino acid synthase of PEP-CTERM/exosortase system